MSDILEMWGNESMENVTHPFHVFGQNDYPRVGLYVIISRQMVHEVKTQRFLRRKSMKAH